jgi:hypothetical protein
VDDQAGGLVDDQHVLVLVDHLEGRGGLLGRGLSAPLRHRHGLAGGEAVVLGPWVPVHRHGALLDQPLGGRARAGGAAGGEERVQPQPGVLRAGL